MIEPAIKAPSADEKPITFASITIPRHMASDTISRDSSFISLEAFLRSVGIRYIPSASQSTRYKMSSPSSPAIAMPPALSLLTAIVERIIIIKTIPPHPEIPNVETQAVKTPPTREVIKIIRASITEPYRSSKTGPSKRINPQTLWYLHHVQRQ